MTREELIQAIIDACRNLDKSMVTIFEIYGQLKQSRVSVNHHLDVIMDLETLLAEEDSPVERLHAGWAVKVKEEEEPPWEDSKCKVGGFKTQSTIENEEMLERASKMKYNIIFRKTDVSYAEVEILAEHRDAASEEAQRLLLSEEYENFNWEESIVDGFDEIVEIEELG